MLRLGLGSKHTKLENNLDKFADEVFLVSHELSQIEPSIVAVGTANSQYAYTQHEILEKFGVTDRRVRSAFLNGGIARRFLTIPIANDGGTPTVESQGDLLRKHRVQGIEMGSQAIYNCLAQANAGIEDVRYLCCVTSTGLLTPGLSALLIRELGLPRDCERLDVVGMGCNAGLNGLQPVSNWAKAHPGELALMLCVEVCSAAYVFDGTIATAVVNSLFGDGAAAVAVKFDPDPEGAEPQLIKFASRLIPEAIDAMRFNWDDHHGKFSFYLDKDVPYVVGANAEAAVENLLKGTAVRRSDIKHWIIHSGGKKVIDSIRVNLGLTKTDVRHTTEVLSKFGNLSSGSFLFSFQRLLDEGHAAQGDYGVMMTMGPGSTIECALIKW
jgi:alkylresorcinol/alkylpyrone synthase/polyketide synthase Type III